MIKIIGKYILRRCGDEYILFPLGAGDMSFCGICSFIEAGAFIWRCIEKRCRRPEIAARLGERYGIDAASSERDTDTFLSELENLRIIENRPRRFYR